MLDAVLLDWESTLVSTTEARRDARTRALLDEGFDLDVLVNDPTLADLIALRTKRYFAERLGKGIVLEPGARAFIERVQLGARLAIVTHASRSETEFVLGLAGLDGAASTIVTADDRTSNGYRLALEHLARRKPLNPARAVAVAQTVHDIQAASTVGLRTVALAAPAHVAVEADGAIDAINGLTLAELARVSGIMSTEHRS